MTYEYAMENRDYTKIDKLNALVDPATFWDDVRQLTRNVRSNHSLRRWQILAEQRERELKA